MMVFNSHLAGSKAAAGRREECEPDSPSHTCIIIIIIIVVIIIVVSIIIIISFSDQVKSSSWRLGSVVALTSWQPDLVR